MTGQEARDNRARIDHSNEVAGIIITTTRQVHPDLFVTLDLRYRIADALWAAGYRKHPEPEITDEAAQLLRGIDVAVQEYRRIFPEPYTLAPNLDLACRAAAIIRGGQT